MQFSFLYFQRVLLLFLTTVLVGSVRPQAVASLISEYDTVCAGENFRLAVKFEIENEWYTYWVNPGDAGIPPEFNFTLPEGIELINTEFPAPKVFSDDEAASFGYNDSVFVIFTFKNDIRTSRNITVTASCSWLVCHDVCLPGSADLKIDLPVSGCNKIVRNDSDPGFLRAANQLPSHDTTMILSGVLRGEELAAMLQFTSQSDSYRLIDILPYENGIFRNLPRPSFTREEDGFSFSMTLENGAVIPTLPMKFLVVFSDSENSIHSFNQELLITK